MRDLFDRDGYFVRYEHSRDMGISFRKNPFSFSFHSLNVQKVPGRKCCLYCNSVLNEEHSIRVCVNGEGSHKYVFENVLQKHVKFDINLVAYDPVARQSRWAVLRNCEIEKVHGNLDSIEQGPMSMTLICEAIDPV